MFNRIIGSARRAIGRRQASKAMKAAKNGKAARGGSNASPLQGAGVAIQYTDAVPVRDLLSKPGSPQVMGWGPERPAIPRRRANSSLPAMSAKAPDKQDNLSPATLRLTASVAKSNERVRPWLADQTALQAPATSLRRQPAMRRTLAQQKAALPPSATGSSSSVASLATSSPSSRSTPPTTPGGSLAESGQQASPYSPAKRVRFAAEDEMRMLEGGAVKKVAAKQAAEDRPVAKQAARPVDVSASFTSRRSGLDALQDTLASDLRSLEREHNLRLRPLPALPRTKA